MNDDPENCIEKADLDEQFDCIQKQLDTSQGAFEEADIRLKELITQKQELNTFKDTFEQIINDYNLALTELKEKQSSYEDFCETEKKCLTSILGDDCKNEVCKKVDEINGKIFTSKKNIEILETKLTKANKDLQSTIKNRDAAKANFEEWKTPKKSIESRFKILEQLKKEFNEERDKQNNTIAYYLLTCKMKFCWITKDDPKVYQIDKFKEKLISFWQEYITAESCFIKNEAYVKNLEQKIKADKEQLKEDKKNVEAIIREELIQLAESDICSKTEPEKSC